MKRFRLSTLLLLVVIVGLAIALVIQERRATRREAHLQAELQLRQGEFRLANEKIHNRELLLRNERMMAQMALTEKIKLNLDLEKMRGQLDGIKGATAK
jgi:uncharacterized protein HemX